MRSIVFCLPGLLGIGFTAVQAADLANDEQKALYAIGVSVSQSLKDLALSESELQIVESGMTDGVLNRPLKLDPKAYAAKVQQLVQARAATVAEREKKSGAAFVTKAAAESGARKTASGAIVTVLQEGKGPSPKASDTVKVHYQGTLINGTVFDSSIQRGQPATFPLGNVIKCWTEGLQQIKVGGKARLVCPADIAYGDRGSPPVIKPGATLIFEVELLEIVK